MSRCALYPDSCYSMSEQDCSINVVDEFSDFEWYGKEFRGPGDIEVSHLVGDVVHVEILMAGMFEDVVMFANAGGFI